jgi:hypothetical protein
MFSQTIIDFTELRQNLRLEHDREKCATENCARRHSDRRSLRLFEVHLLRIR